MLDGIVPPLIVILAAAVLLWLRRLHIKRHSGHALAAEAAVAIGLILVTATLELGMGRLMAYKNGPVRLRVGDVRVVYDVSATSAEVLAIVAKSEAQSWLAQFGSPE